MHLVSPAGPLLHHAQLTRIAVVHAQSRPEETSSSVSSSTGSFNITSSSSTQQSPMSYLLSSPSLSLNTIQGCFTAVFSIAKYYGEDALLCSEFCAVHTACLSYVLDSQDDSNILLTAATPDAFEETLKSGDSLNPSSILLRKSALKMVNARLIDLADYETCSRLLQSVQ